ncbi:MAG: hypothetical protein ACE5EL_03175, partial [Anaerolineae bacterium]
SAGVVIDAVRFVKLGLDRGLSGTLEGPSSYLMKTPPVQHPDAIARELAETFIRGNSRGEILDGSPVATPAVADNGAEPRAEAEGQS